MINVIEINAICDELGTQPPKVVQYANCTAIIIRNGDGEKVLIVADEGMSRESVKHKIAAAFKVKAENLPSPDKVAEIYKSDEVDDKPALEPKKPEPITPAKDIREHQEAKKPHNK